MAQNKIERVAAEATLANWEEALDRARRGDRHDPEFEEEVRSGALLPLHFHVSVDAVTAEGEAFTVDRHNDDVWIAAPEHLPELEEDVRQTASKDFGALSADLRERGFDVSGDDLARMYVGVTLDDSLRDTCKPGEVRRRTSVPAPHSA
jgi:hypothetical protein